MPAGVRLFVGYALVIMAGVGLAMPKIIDDMTGAVPISLPGLVAMALLAFTIFTVTLVLQRKQAAHGLALVLSSLTLPAVPLAWLSLAGLASRIPITLFLIALAALLFLGLTRHSAREYLSEP